MYGKPRTHHTKSAIIGNGSVTHVRMDHETENKLQLNLSSGLGLRFWCIKRFFKLDELHVEDKK